MFKKIVKLTKKKEKKTFPLSLKPESVKSFFQQKQKKNISLSKQRANKKIKKEQRKFFKSFAIKVKNCFQCSARPRDMDKV
jgi:hypothetical protein